MNYVENRKIIKRVYWCFDIELKSPLCIGNGLEEETDNDILLNSEGCPFIPGTSVAGAIRNYMDFKDDDKKCIMGSKSGIKIGGSNFGPMSAIFFSDILFKSRSINTRDGVALTSEKIAATDNGAKFDYQVLDTGAEAKAFINYVVRENEDESQFDKLILTFYERVNSGEIRFGAKKNRGFGRIKIKEEARRKIFTEDNVDEFIEKKNQMDLSENYDAFSVNILSSSLPEEKFERLIIPLTLEGGISIRQYSAEPGAPDFGTIKSNGHAVIPGTSWAGAFRADVRKILIELGKGKSDVDDILYEWFGSGKDTDAKQSEVVFGESIIIGGEDKVMTRNAINRFDASTKEGALYTELVHFGGTTDLSIMVRKRSKDNKPLLAVLALALENLRSGFLAVGGETSIGRGLFSIGDDFKNEYYNDEYMKALFEYLKNEDYRK